MTGALVRLSGIQDIFCGMKRRWERKRIYGNSYAPNGAGSQSDHLLSAIDNHLCNYRQKVGVFSGLA